MFERIIDGRTDLVFDFVAAGNAADSTDENGVPLIKWCAYYGDVSAIRHLMAEGVPLESLGENLDLNGVAFHGHWQLVQFLVESGADVKHALPDTGETPLHAALCRPNRPVFDLIVRILLASGADPNAPTIPGRETGSFMRDSRTKGETPLHRAAAFGSIEVLELLIEAEARIDARDAAGETPLSWASWHARPDAILKLLCYDGFSIHPDRNSKSDHGRGWGAMDGYLLGKPHV